jgi:hypothetical protein
MSFVFTCPSCGEGLTGEEIDEGLESSCPLCSAAIVIQPDQGVKELQINSPQIPKCGNAIKKHNLLSHLRKIADFCSKITKIAELIASLAAMQLRALYEEWFKLLPSLRAIGLSLIQQENVMLVSQKLAREVDAISAKISNEYAKEDEYGSSQYLGWKENMGRLCRRVFFRIRIITFSLFQHVKAVEIGKSAINTASNQELPTKQIENARAIKERIYKLKKEARRVQLVLPLPLRHPLPVAVMAGLSILAAISLGEESKKVASSTKSSQSSHNSTTISSAQTSSRSGQSRRHLSASLKLWTEQTLANTSLSEESKTVIINRAADMTDTAIAFEGGNRNEIYKQALHEQMKLLGIRPRQQP